MNGRDQWRNDFRKRLSFYLAPEHFRHGFVGDTIENYGDDGGPDPTYEDVFDPGRYDFGISGKCPCGEKVHITASQPTELFYLFQAITDEDFAETMRNNMSPFVNYER